MCGAQDLADAVFAEHLEEYLPQELAWLHQMFDTKAAPHKGLSLHWVAEFFAWNQEARPGAIMDSASCW